ncbi:MAG: VIT1/CCC1 transporter family protein [Patescibacteria group bacterium]
MKSVINPRVFINESHSNVSWLRDVILGGQDGLVNVLGIVLGVAAASTDTKILITASLAAAFAEAVSMAAVAYTSSLAERDHYKKEVEKERQEIIDTPEDERNEVRDIYKRKGFEGKLLEEIVSNVTSNNDKWLISLTREELGLSQIETKTILSSSAIVGVAALVASFIPILPFFFLPHGTAILASLTLSGLALFTIGAYEAKTYVGNWLKNGFQMLIIGLGAAFIGFLIGNIFKVE